MSADLTEWTTLPGYVIGATNDPPTSPGVDVAENDANADTITVTIPMAPQMRKFARLTATITP